MLPTVVFGLVRRFFANFSKVSKGSPFIFFLFFQRMDVQKLPNAPYTFVGTMRLTEDQKKSRKIQKKINFFLFFPHVGFVEENT